MPYIEKLIADVEKTHKHYGEFVAMMQISAKARKFVLIVSPSGCGKSKVMELLVRDTPNAYAPLKISIASLANKVDKLTSFRSIIAVDDIANIQTPYGRVSTINTLSALCYTHRVEPSMQGEDFCIEDFYGAGFVGIQPIILKDLMLSPEWDASIQDKALRYYHLYRPVTPSISLPDVKLSHGIEFDAVNDFEPDKSNPIWQNLITLASSQWSIARVKEHLIDMLKAISALEGRKDVIISDYLLLLRLLKPMAFELLAVEKEELEGEKFFNNNLIALLAEYYSYGGEFLLSHITNDFKITSLSQAYRIMQAQNGFWKQVSKSPTLYQPSDKLLKLLKKYDLEVKGDDNKH